jgi:hypothetical protein
MNVSRGLFRARRGLLVPCPLVRLAVALLSSPSVQSYWRFLRRLISRINRGLERVIAGQAIGITVAGNPSAVGRKFPRRQPHLVAQYSVLLFPHFAVVAVLATTLAVTTNVFDGLHRTKCPDRSGRDAFAARWGAWCALGGHGCHPTGSVGRPTGFTASKFNPNRAKVRTTKARLASSCFSAG